MRTNKPIAHRNAKFQYEVRCQEPGDEKDYPCETFCTKTEALAYIDGLNPSADDKLYEQYFVVEVNSGKEELDEVREYRRRLTDALRKLKDNGERAWNDDDIGRILRSYSNDMIKDAMSHISPCDLR